MADDLCPDDAALVAELFREAHRAGGARGHVRGTLPTSGCWFTSYVAAARGATRRRIEFQVDVVAATASTRRLDAVFMIT